MSHSIFKTIITGSAWSFIGVVLAAAFFYWQEYRNPFDFKIELIDEFNLVEVKEKINDLSILYQNEDILKSKKEIKVIRVSVSNKGDTILQSYYDQLEPFGLRFFKSKILNAEVTSSNSKDLRNKLISNYSEDATVDHDDLNFSKVIFDKNDFAIIKITLLQASEDELNIKVLGKLANIKNLIISRASSQQEKPISPWVYIAGSYFCFLGFIFAFIFIMDHLESRSKNKKINKYISEHGELSDTESKIVELYKGLGRRTERLIRGLLKGNVVLDFKDIIELDTPSSSFNRLLFPLLYPYGIQFHSLPAEIFCVEGTSVSFNSENEEFIPKNRSKFTLNHHIIYSQYIEGWLKPLETAR